VSAPKVALNNLPIGKDLEVCTYGSLPIPAPAGGLTVTIAVADPLLAKVSSDRGVAGSANVNVAVPAGSSATPTFCLQALAGSGTVAYTADAPDYDQATATVSMFPSGFIICRSVSGTSCSGFGGSFSTRLTDADTTLKIAPARLDPVYLNLAEIQMVRPGVTSGSVAVDSTNPSVGMTTLSPVTFSGGDVPNERTSSFHPLAAGTTVIQATAAGFSTASNNNNINVTVTP